MGWYLEPVTLLYAADGRTCYFCNSEVPAQLTVGWFLEPPSKLCALDGRTMYVGKSEVAIYRNLGWYLPSQVTLIFANPAYSDGRAFYALKSNPVKTLQDALRKLGRSSSLDTSPYGSLPIYSNGGYYFLIDEWGSRKYLCTHRVWHNGTIESGINLQ